MQQIKFFKFKLALYFSVLFKKFLIVVESYFKPT